MGSVAQRTRKPGQLEANFNADLRFEQIHESPHQMMPHIQDDCVVCCCSNGAGGRHRCDARSTKARQGLTDCAGMSAATEKLDDRVARKLAARPLDPDRHSHGEQPLSHNPRLERESPTATGLRNCFPFGKWRREWAWR